MLRLIILLVCVRHLMLLGPRKLVDGCRGPIMTAVSIVDHHQLSIASSTVSWKRLASASRSAVLYHVCHQRSVLAKMCDLHTQLLRVGFCRSRWPTCSALGVSSPYQGKAVVDGGAETD